jgi:hypothetical protein
MSGCQDQNSLSPFIRAAVNVLESQVGDLAWRGYIYLGRGSQSPTEVRMILLYDGDHMQRAVLLAMSKKTAGVVVSRIQPNLVRVLNRAASN